MEEKEHTQALNQLNLVKSSLPLTNWVILSKFLISHLQIAYSVIMRLKKKMYEKHSAHSRP